MPERTVRAAVGLAAAAIALAATAIARSEGGDPAPARDVPERLTVTSTTDAGAVLPGGAATGRITVTNPGSVPRSVADVAFTPATSQACARTGLALAPTVAPTAESPLEVPAGGTAVLGWAGYMDGDGDHACQGATLTSEVVLDGEPAGTVTLTAGTLEQPPPPTGGLTTSTRAAVHWSPSTVADPGWVVERAVAGTDDWQPACRTSPARPVRALTCTDTGLTRSTAYTYRVTLRTGHWHTTSRPSGPVTTQERPSA